MPMETIQKIKDSSSKARKTFKIFIFSVFVLGAFSFFSVAKADITTGLSGHWKLNEVSGTTVSDSSGNGRNGTASGTLWTTGKIGGGLKFDSVNDFVDFSDILDASSGDMTVASWVKFDQLDQDQNIIGKRHSADPWYSWIFAIGDTNMPYFCVNNTSAQWYCSGYYNGDISTGNWYHLVGVKSGNNLSFYVNGSNSITWNDTILGTVLGSDSELGFNTYPGWGNNFSGTIDDVRIYSRALTPADVSELYTGLVGHWKFNESTGTVATDSTAEGNNGTVSGATWTTSGMIENALSFNGASSVTKTGSATVLKPSTEVSVSAWIKAGSTDTGGSEIVSMGDSYAVRLDTTGNIRFFYYNGTTWVSTVTSGVNLKNNLWHYVVAQKTSSSVEIYVDGVLKITSANTGTITYNQGANFVIGKHGNGDAIYDFTGLIDDVRIYNRPLTAQEISTAYVNATSDLVAHWKLNEGSGTAISDSSGNGRNGVMNGATWTTGNIGAGLSFDGINDYINLGDILDAGSGNMTVTAWVKFGALNANQKIAIKSHSLSPWLSWQLQLWGSQPQTNGVEPMFTLATTDIGYYSAGYWGEISADTWYHISGVKNGNSLLFYLNGTTNDTWSDTISGTVQNGDGSLWIGSGWNGTDEPFNGVIDDVRIYNRALTSEEIYALYNTDAPGLIAHWKFDENSGSTASDFTPNANNGSINGATWINGVSGGALNFNGSSNYVFKSSPSLVLKPSSQVVASAWIKATSTDVDGSDIISMGDSYAIRIETNGNVSFFYHNGTTWVGVYSSGINVLNNQWHLITGQKTPSSIEIYVDGVLKGSVSNTGTISYVWTNVIGNAGTDLRIGRHGHDHFPGYAGDRYYFKGSMDDVRIYNRALTAQEILNIYNSTYPSSSGNLESPRNVGVEVVCNPAVNLFWTAPSAQVQSYKVESVGVWPPVNTTNTSYTDNTVTRDTYYIYDVIAVYDEGESAPASILLKTPNDADCVASDTELIAHNCPYVSDIPNNKFSLDFYNGIDSGIWRSEPNGMVVSQQMPAGRYKVRLVGLDGYPNRVNVYQPNEQYYVSLKNSSGVEIARTSNTKDLKDNVVYDYRDEVVDESLIVSDCVNTSQAMWGGGWDMTSVGSISPVCGYFEKLDGGGSSCQLLENNNLPVLITSFTATPNPIGTGSSSVLDWTVENAVSCTAYGGWSGQKNFTAGSESTGSLTNTTGYTLTCSDINGNTDTKGLTITVLPVISVNCGATPQTANIGQPVTWTIVPDPAGAYTYSWSGDENLTGSTESVIKSYLTVGTKNASVDISGGGAMPQQCTATVKVMASPSFDEF